MDVEWNKIIPLSELINTKKETCVSNKVKVGFYIDRKAHTRLKGLAERDHRSMSSELEWVINKAWQVYMARLRADAETAARLSRTETHE